MCEGRGCAGVGGGGRGVCTMCKLDISRSSVTPLCFHLIQKPALSLRLTSFKPFLLRHESELSDTITTDYNLC